VAYPPTAVDAVVEGLRGRIALLFQTRAVTAGQLCEFRRALEVEAAQLAAVRRSRQELEEIAVALDAYVASSQDTAAQNLHGRAFHHAVARASGNPLLTETMTSLNDAFAACFHLQHIARAPDPAQLIHDLHWPILDTIRRRDKAGARQAMLAHFDQLQNALSDLDISDRAIGNQTEGNHAVTADSTGSARRMPASLAGRG
jgi:GntR family transcriptional repressor for pyruvate dehydrogenase complex